MASDFFHPSHSNPIDELPTGKLERALTLRNGLVALCEGRGNLNESVYRVLRREFMDAPVVSSLVPPFVRTSQDTAAVWAFLKGHSGQWEPRRQFVREQFIPLIDRLERSSGPADTLISEAILSYDAEGIISAWDRALARREADPAGAITAARTLLESVCKHLLEAAGNDTSYGTNIDLPKLYRMASESLNIAPSQHSEETFKRILGGAATIVEGLGTLRNRLGDAHATGRKPVKPAPRHAALAVNMAGSMALFLIETANARSG